MSGHLGDVLTDENVFAVFFKDGHRQIVLANNEDDLPVNLDDVAFAASLAEMTVLVNEMQNVMALGVTDDDEGGIVIRTDTNGGSNDIKWG